ncbi:MAG: type I restriction-modification system subunit M N-terminal domain-containing protein [Gallionella sp.]|nr:type I restriction-modification system subunit M N-terminal domain-containing protein [Gallionella sp.]
MTSRKLRKTADKLRANIDAAEYKHLVLGLIFVEYVSDTFAAHRAALAIRFTDETDEYFLHTPAFIPTELKVSRVDKHRAST